MYHSKAYNVHHVFHSNTTGSSWMIVQMDDQHVWLRDLAYRSCEGSVDSKEDFQAAWEKLNYSYKTSRQEFDQAIASGKVDFSNHVYQNNVIDGYKINGTAVTNTPTVRSSQKTVSEANALSLFSICLAILILAACRFPSNPLFYFSQKNCNFLTCGKNNIKTPETTKLQFYFNSVTKVQRLQSFCNFSSLLFPVTNQTAQGYKWYSDFLRDKYLEDNQIHKVTETQKISAFYSTQIKSTLL